MLVEETVAIGLAIGVSTFAIFATSKPRGKVPFSFAAVCSWVLLAVTTFYSFVNSFMSSFGFWFLNGDFVQGMLVLLVAGGAIAGFIQFGS